MLISRGGNLAHALLPHSMLEQVLKRSWTESPEGGTDSGTLWHGTIKSCSGCIPNVAAVITLSSPITMASRIVGGIVSTIYIE